MNFRPRSLYTKIFLWFCLTIGASTTVVVLIAALAGSQPFGRRWMAMTQDLYAHSAVDFYTTGGAPALTHYLSTIEQASGIEGHLILQSASGQGTDVFNEPFPTHAALVYRRVLANGVSTARLGRYWTAASAVTTTDGQRYIFVMEAHPMRGFMDGTFFFSFAPRLLLGVALVALFCLLLARHITQPIRLLEAAAIRMSAGDLSVRTLPALHTGRADELASMAAAFDSMAERIDTLIRTQRQTLADISHELRSPLTRIGVSLELLRRGELDVIDPMQADLDRLNLMIGQVLELTRFELQPPAATLHLTDLRPILEELVETANYEGRAEDKSVTLSAPSGPAFVLGEDFALRSCLENIIRNALQYSSSGGLIDITLQPAASYITLHVDDTGPGVPPESLAHLFAPFFRVPNTATLHPQGTGLGLSISSRIVTRYGGTITAVNRTPHGLSIRLILPRS